MENKYKIKKNETKREGSVLSCTLCSTSSGSTTVVYTYKVMVRVPDLSRDLTAMVKVPQTKSAAAAASGAARNIVSGLNLKIGSVDVNKAAADADKLRRDREGVNAAPFAQGDKVTVFYDGVKPKKCVVHPITA